MLSFFKRNIFSQKAKQAAAKEAHRFANLANEFANQHPEALIILGDPKTEVLFMAHNGIIAPVRIMDRAGHPVPIVSAALKHRKKDQQVDQFLLAVDGGLFAIANALYNKYKASLKGKILGLVQQDVRPAKSEIELADGSQLSPIQLIDKP